MTAAATFSEVKVVDVGDLRPSTYNPRQVFADRLELVALSLSRLGFLLPLYVTPDGEILSGHQRHHVATEMLGATKVPVVVTRAVTPAQAKSLNLLFNRATNDLPLLASSEPLADALARSNVPERAKALPALDAESPDFMPILGARPVSTVELLDANPVWTDKHGISMSAQVVKMGQTDIMPIVVTSDLRIVNGAARAAAAAGLQGRPEVLTVTVPDDVADIAHGLLNLLSMRYEVSGELADHLRHNGFRAAPSVRHTMSRNSIWDLTGGKASHHFDHTRKEHQQAWLRHYGPSVLDFGAGNYWDARHMEGMGATVAAFEPYYAWDRDKARAAAEEWFFSRLTDGRRFDSLFLSNVMNTVPFEEDRRKIMRILAALADDDSTLFTTTRSFREVDAKGRQRGDMRTSISSAAGITLEEVGTRITSVSHKPAIQKFHGLDEFRALLAVGFHVVDCKEAGGWLAARCRKPRKPSADELREAIEFEFDLPWDDAPRFGMVDRAKEAFGAFTGLDLS